MVDIKHITAAINNNVAVVINNFFFSLEVLTPLDKELIPVLFINEFFNKINKNLIMTTLHTQSAWYNTQIFRFNKKTNRLLKIDWLLTLYQNN